MKNANRTYFGAIRPKAKVTDSRRLAVAVAVLFVNAFFVRAQVTDAGVRVNFPFDSAVLNTNYMSNSDALVSLDQIAQEAIASNTTLDVVSYSSPEGNYTYNLRLSEQRAKTISDYLGSKYPGIGLNIVSGAESWDDLRNDVLKDTRLAESSRREILDIIDSNREPDAKEKLLKANSEYKTLYSSYFRGLRYANISLRIENSGETAAQHTTTATFSTLHDAASSGMGMPIVYYSLSEDFIRPDYMCNTLNLKEIRRILSYPANRQKQIVLEGSASPEGPQSINNRLGKDRSQNLADWLIGQFPDLEGRIVVRTKGEDWEGLRASIDTCSALDAQAKDELLAIIDSNITPEKKETLLRNHSAYGIVEKECLPYIRYARFAGFELAEPATVSVTEPAIDSTAVTPHVADTITTQPADTTTALPQVDTTGTKPEQGILLPSIPVIPDWPEAAKRERKPVAALTTNLLFDATTALVGFHTLPLTLGVEVPFGEHWSAFADYTVTAPWHAWNNNADCMELMHGAIGGRYYFGGKRVLDGLYAYASVGGGYYDFEHNGKGYQGEEILAALGGGYALTFNDHWSLNFGLGFGPLYSPYRYYEGRSNNEHLMFQYSGKYRYFFITDAKVTLTYLFYTKRK